MRVLAAYVGICCALLGILMAALQEALSAQQEILNVPESIALAVLGVFLMHWGREYLPAWLGFIVVSDDSSDD